MLFASFTDFVLDSGFSSLTSGDSWPGDYALVAVPAPRSLNELACIYSADRPLTVPFAPSADLCPRLWFSGLKGCDNWPWGFWLRSSSAMVEGSEDLVT